MGDTPQRPEVQPEAARALVVGSCGTCPVCRERPLVGRQQVCSGRCRAALSRQRREQARAERDRQIGELLKAALALL
jgi:predicted nucleic acid-binding Zn ribbon protein